MIKWIIRRFIREPENTSDQRVRGQYGTLGSVVGISVNVLLSVVKFLVGTFTGSVAVTADAEDPTRCLVDFSFTVAHGLNQIWLTAHITV